MSPPFPPAAVVVVVLFFLAEPPQLAATRAVHRTSAARPRALGVVVHFIGNLQSVVRRSADDPRSAELTLPGSYRLKPRHRLLQELGGPRTFAHVRRRVWRNVARRRGA